MQVFIVFAAVGALDWPVAYAAKGAAESAHGAHVR
jgi:hypothetical protein